MITTLSTVLKRARERHYAVPAFNCFNLETAQAIIQAAETSASPVIIQISESAMRYGGPSLMAAVRQLARDASVKVVIHLDHCTTLDSVSLGLKWGASSAMFDGSALRLIDNIAQTKRARQITYRYKASLEGEIGTIGGQESFVKGQAGVVDPHEAAHFVRATRVDAVALGLGTSHGLPVPHETVHVETLKAYYNLCKTPVVLHGASNLPPATIRAAIRHGVTKVNVDTELRQAFTGAVRDYLQEHPAAYNPRDYLGPAREAAQARAVKLIRSFGAVNEDHAVHRHR